MSHNIKTHNTNSPLTLTQLRKIIKLSLTEFLLSQVYINILAGCCWFLSFTIVVVVFMLQAFCVTVLQWIMSKLVVSLESHFLILTPNNWKYLFFFSKSSLYLLCLTCWREAIKETCDLYFCHMNCVRLFNVQINLQICY